MNQVYLKAVEDSFLSVMTSMVGVDLTADAAHPKCHSDALVDDSITSIISLNGSDLNFTVALSLSKKTSLAVAQKMLQGMDIEEGSPMIVDLVGELANLVVGGAKNSLDEAGDRFELSLPTVVVGSDYQIEHKTGDLAWIIRFSSELGEFYIEASYRELS